MIAVSCSPSDGDEPSYPTQGSGDVRWLAEGNGEANSEPLWVLRPGHQLRRHQWTINHASVGNRTYDTIVGEPVEVGGQSFTPFGNVAWEGYYPRRGPTEPAHWKYLRQDAEQNIWLHGQPRVGLFGDRLLWIPGEVRVGMKWESYVGDEKILTGEVVSRQVRETVFGERPVWGIRLSDWRVPGAEGTFENPLPIAGAQFFGFFAEGRGPVNHLPFHDATAPQLDAGGLDERIAVELAIVPLEPADEKPPATAITLEPANDGVPVNKLRGVPKHVSGFPDPDDPDALIVTMIMRDDAVGGSAIDPDGGTIFFPDEDEYIGPCFRLHPDGRTENLVNVRNDLCAPGSTVIVGRDGELVGSSIRSNGSPLTDLLANDGVEDIIAFVHQGMWQSPDGVWHGAATSEDAPAPTKLDGRWITLLDLTGSTPRGIDPVGWFSIDAPGPSRAGRGGPAYPLQVQQSGDGSLRYLEIGTHLQFGSHEPKTGWAQRHDAYPRKGSVNIVRYQGGQTVVMASLDGRIEAIHVQDDGLGIEVLGDVAAPAGEFVTGAFLWRDTLWVSTQRNFRGVDNWYQPDGINFAVNTDFGEVMLYRAHVPGGGAQVRPPDNVWGITGMRSGRDLVVCWPNPAEEVAPDWTLGGEPVEVRLGPDGRCALLIRSLSDERDLASAAAWVAEGTVPGSRRVAVAGLGNGRDVWPFALGPGEATQQVTGEYAQEHLFAPLMGGGFVSKDARVLDAQAVRARRNSLLYEFVVPSWQRLDLFDPRGADHAGGGIWGIRAAQFGEDVATVALLGPESVTVADAGDVQTWSPLITASEGGGAVLVRTYRPNFPTWREVMAIRSDGSATILPTPSYEDIDFRLADDTTCGTSDGQLMCTSLSGEETAIGPVTGDPALALFTASSGVCWPAAPTSGTGPLLECLANGQLAAVSFELPAADSDVQWRADLYGNVIGVPASGGRLLRLAEGALVEAACSGVPLGEVARILRENAADTGPRTLALASGNTIFDVANGIRLPLPSTCQLFGEP